MVQLVIAIVVVLGGVGLAYLIRRRDSRRMARGGTWTVPAQLDLSDFGAFDTDQVAVVFSSATCDACAGTWERLCDLAGADTAVALVSFQEHRDLHDRYGIDAVPTLVIADAEGVVTRSFVGPPEPGELAAALGNAEEAD